MKRRDRRIRRRCVDAIDRLALPPSPTARQIAAAVARLRGRPLNLLPVAGMGAPCGLWVASTDADYVMYESATSGIHRRHIVLHEVGHMLLGHAGMSAEHTSWKQLFPHLEPALIRMVMGRATYSSGEEREAEIFADTAHALLGLERPIDWPVTQTPSNPGHGVHRLRRILGPASGTSDA